MPTLAVLVATTRTQGTRDSDFVAATVGELVDITSTCARSNGCGCCQLFTGLDTRLCTTTVEVVELEMTMDDYLAAHLDSLVRAGLPNDTRTRSWAADAAQDMARIAADFPVGTVVERDGDHIEERV